MLTAETKRHIDAARDVLVGKIPDPKSQVHEITNALIYKFMDDMDDRAVTMGGKRRFFTDEYEKFSWRKIMDPRIGAHERIGLYTEALARLSKNPNLPELFRGIFRNAYLPFNDGRTLTLFLTEIDFFDYRHQEELGDAYEYLLSIMGSQGDAGQFRTPRHIIDFIVKVVDPSKDDTVLDPACGTAGFLISAYKHVLSKHDGKDDLTKSEKPLSADEKRKLHESYQGFDIDDNMVKMAQVNLYLHGFPNPNVLVHDTLSSEDYWQDRYSVIMANPPFMTPKGGIVPHNKFGVQSNRAEVLFVDYIMSHLKPNGRAGIIVPEGIIFQSSTAHKQLRKNLLNDGLYAVVSLPSGVFNPYAGVKTSILFFDNDRAKQQSEILFIKITKEGYDLGAQRRPLCNDNNDKSEWCSKHSDFPEALDVINKWKNDEKAESNLSVYVEKSKIAENGDYNLSGDRYHVATDYINAKWPMVELGQVCDVTTGNSAPQDKALFHNGRYPFFRTSDVGVAHLSDNLKDVRDWLNDRGIIGLKLFKKGTILFPKSGASTFLNHRVIMGFDGYVSSHLAAIIPKNALANNKYIYHLLIGIDAKSLTSDQAYPSLKASEIAKIKLPLPPLEIQQQIVAELDGYQNIITGARQVVDNWKPHIDIDPGWKNSKLGEVASFSQGVQVDLPLQLKVPREGYVKFLRIENYTQQSNDFRYIPEKLGRDKTVTANDIVVVRYGASAGFIGRGLEGILANNLFVVKISSELIINDYLYYYLVSDTAQKLLKEAMAGGAMPALSFGIVKDLPVSFPPIEEQRDIVIKIESERAIVDANKKLIAMYEQKMKDMIARLWNDKTD